MIIGLSGYARSGKDTVAEILKQDGFTRIAFADGIREALYRLNPKIVGTNGASTPLASYVNAFGWEDAKKHSDVREWLQRMGTEVGRAMFGDTVWIDYALKQVDPGKNYVITDVRYPNEAIAIMKAGGKIWRIERPGFGPANSHISEIAMEGFIHDQIIINDGSIEDLALKLRGAM